MILLATQIVDISLKLETLEADLARSEAIHVTSRLDVLQVLILVF